MMLCDSPFTARRVTQRAGSIFRAALALCCAVLGVLGISPGAMGQQLQPNDRIVLASGQTITGLVVAETSEQALVLVNELEPGGEGDPSAGEGWPRGAMHWIDKSEITSLDRRLIAAEPPPMSVEEGAMAIAAVRIGVGTLDVIGQHVTAESVFLALRAIQSRARAEGIDPSTRVVVVLQFNSRGGLLAEVPWLVEIIDWAEREFAVVIGLVERAESAAALVALACNRLVFAPAGVLGSAVAFEDADEGPRAVVGRLREDAIEIARRSAERGGRDPAIGEAMASRSGLSYHAGSGRFLLGEGEPLRIAPAGTVLALSSVDAQRIGVSETTVTELLSLLGHAGIERPGSLYAATPMDVLVRHAEAGRFLLPHAELLADSIAGSVRTLESTQTTDSERGLVLPNAWRELDRLMALVASYPELARHHAFDPAWLAARAERLAAFGPRPRG